MRSGNMSKESEITAQMKEYIGTVPVKLFTELLHEKLDKFKNQLITCPIEEVPVLRGRAQECKDLLKLIAPDFS